MAAGTLSKSVWALSRRRTRAGDHAISIPNRSALHGSGPRPPPSSLCVLLNNCESNLGGRNSGRAVVAQSAFSYWRRTCRNPRVSLWPLTPFAASVLTDAFSENAKPHSQDGRVMRKWGSENHSGPTLEEKGPRPPSFGSAHPMTEGARPREPWPTSPLYADAPQSRPAVQEEEGQEISPDRPPRPRRRPLLCRRQRHVCAPVTCSAHGAAGDATPGRAARCRRRHPRPSPPLAPDHGEEITPRSPLTVYVIKIRHGLPPGCFYFENRHTVRSFFCTITSSPTTDHPLEVRLSAR